MTRSDYENIFLILVFCLGILTITISIYLHVGLRHDLISAQADIAQLKMENGNLANRVIDYESKEVVENAYMFDVMRGGKE
jgi:hypothetical protein